MRSIQQLRSRLDQEKGKLDHIEKSLARKSELLSKLEKRKDNIEQAQAVIREVALKVQKELEYHLSGVVSTALAAVFDDPYEFKAQFVERRGKTECDLLFSDGENDCSPLDASGGGAVDVASFALRIAFLSMENPKSRRVIILDEPFRFLSPDRQGAASEMLKEISSKLGIQVLLISHAEDAPAGADRIFEITKQGEVSKVEVVDDPGH